VPLHSIRAGDALTGADAPGAKPSVSVCGVVSVGAHNSDRLLHFMLSPAINYSDPQLNSAQLNIQSKVQRKYLRAQKVIFLLIRGVGSLSSNVPSCSLTRMYPIQKSCCLMEGYLYHIDHSYMVGSVYTFSSWVWSSYHATLPSETALCSSAALRFVHEAL